MLNELKAQASLDYSINYTVNAEVISQGQLTTSIEPIYKCSNPIDLTLNTIQLYNVESTPVTVSFYVNGSLPVNQTVIFEIPALGSAIYKEDGTLDIMDSTGEVINRVGLTDAELRATPVPVTGTVTSTPSGTQDVNIVGDSVGLATETTLREVRDYVDNIETELISINTNTTGKSTEATLIQVRDYLDTVETKLSSLLTELQLKADLTETQPVSLASAPLPTGASTEATLIQVRDYLDTVETKLQSLITALGSPFQAGGSIGNTTFRADAGTDLNTSALNLEATQQLVLTALSTIIGYTDTIESLIATTNSLITTLNTKDFATQTTLNTLLKPADTLSRLTAITNVVQVADNSGSLTVDAPVATPVHVRLSDGSAAITTLPVSIASNTPTEVNSAAILATLGAVADAIVAAGATGSISAKLRRATQGLEDLKTGIILAAGSNTIGTVNAPTITKVTQGSTGFTVQNLKDAGRTTLGLTMEFTATGTSEALATITESRNGASGVSFTTRIITLGKRLRIQSISMEVETLGSGTAPQRMYLRLRTNTAGAVTTSSPIQGVWAVVNSTAVVKSGNTATFSFPDGLEFAGDGVANYGFTIQFPDYVATTATVAGKVTITAFEY